MPTHFSNYGIIYGVYTLAGFSLSWWVKHRAYTGCLWLHCRVPGNFSRTLLLLVAVALFSYCLNTFAGAWYSVTDPPKWNKGSAVYIRLNQLVMLPCLIWTAAIASLAAPEQLGSESVPLIGAEDELKRSAKRQRVHRVVKGVAIGLSAICALLGLYGYVSSMHDLVPVSRLGIVTWDLNPKRDYSFDYALQSLLITCLFNGLAGISIWARFGDNVLCVTSFAAFALLLISQIMGDLVHFFVEPVCEMLMIVGLHVAETRYIGGPMVRKSAEADSDAPLPVNQSV